MELLMGMMRSNTVVQLHWLFIATVSLEWSFPYYNGFICLDIIPVAL